MLTSQTNYDKISFPQNNRIIPHTKDAQKLMPKDVVF